MITLEPGGPRPPTTQEKAWTRAALELVKQAESHAAADWVLSTVLENGQLGRETDTGRTKFGDGVTTWENLPYSDATAIATGKTGIVLDGLGEVIQPGVYGTTIVRSAGIITAATLTADVPGDIVVDVRKASFANYPAVNSICGAALPTLSSAVKSQDATLAGWTVALAAGDILQYAVISAAIVRRATLTMNISAA